jgi:GNAT superfamily N-acetyltransferase
MSELDFRTAGSIDGIDRTRFIRIYEESFPRDERDESDALLESIASGDRTCHIVYADGDLVGLAVLYTLSADHVPFLEYLAVDSGHRSRGIGSRFLRHITDRLRSAEQRTPGVVFEVETPEHAASDDRLLRQRRIEFYTRNGAVLVDCARAYEAPNLAGDGTVPYLLMWLPLNPDIRELKGDMLRACVEAILTESYGLSPDDRLVTGVLARLAC